MLPTPDPNSGRTVIEDFHVPAVVIDAEHRIVRVTEEASIMFEGRLMDHSVHDLVPDSMRERHRELVEAQVERFAAAVLAGDMSGRRMGHQRRIVGQTLLGKPIEVDIRLSPRQDGERGANAVIWPVGDLIQAEERQRAAEAAQHEAEAEAHRLQLEMQAAAARHRNELAASQITHVNSIYFRIVLVILGATLAIMAFTGMLVWSGTLGGETFEQLGLVAFGLIASLVGGLGGLAVGFNSAAKSQDHTQSSGRSSSGT